MSDFCIAEAFEPAPEAAVVRVVHPAGALAPTHLNALRAGIRALATSNPNATIQWREEDARRVHNTYLAGDDEARLAELVAAIDDDAVDIIWAARGGSGAARIAPQVLAHLKRAAATKRPKVLVGFSDITTLLCCWVQVGWPAVHGPVVTSLAPEGAPVSVDLPEVWRVLTGRTRLLRFAPGRGPVLEGRLVGGNLTVLASLAGSDILPHGPGHIWLLEDVLEAVYRTDRSLTQLRLAGALTGSSGLWLGAFSDQQRRPVHAEVAALCLADLDLPILSNAPAGHHGPITAIPLGIPVRLDPVAGMLGWPVGGLNA
jgi:muramoyltetrapeptide carboxypeptidase